MEHRYFTTGEAARLCGVQLNTIKSWIRRGEIPAVRTPGGHWRIPRDGFLSFMRRMGMPLPEQSIQDVPAAPRILIIDDDPAAHELMRGMLQLAFPDCRVHSAFDGCAGLIDIGRHRPDLIVLDIMMPGINGLEIIHRLKGPDSPMPGARVIAVTAASDRRLVVNRIRAAGPEALVFKPVDPERFIAAVRQALHAHQAPSAQPARRGFHDTGAGI